MEEEKIIQMKDQDLPIDKELLFQKLQEIPEDIKTGYAKAGDSLIEEILLWKNIFTGNSSIAKHLIDNLDLSQLERLNTILLNLISADVQKNISKIMQATYDLTGPTPESEKKAIELINLIKSSDFDCNKAWKELVLNSRQLCLLATSILVINMGKQFEYNLLEQLSRMPASEFDGIIELCEEKLKCQIAE